MIIEIVIMFLLGIVAVKLALWFVKSMFLAVCHLWGFIGDTFGIFPKTKIGHRYRHLSYFTPRYTFFYMIILTTIIPLVTLHNLGVLWRDWYSLILPIPILFFYFFGMHNRFKNNKKVYKEVIKANKEYMDLVKIPVVTIIAAIEFMVALIDATPRNISQMKWEALVAYTSVFNAILKNFNMKVVQWELWIIYEIGLLYIIGYFVSLLVEVAAFFIIQIMTYLDVSKAIDMY